MQFTYDIGACRQEVAGTAETPKRHLKLLVREGYLDCWDDTHIRPGDDWQQEVRTTLDTAQAAVLLISADFFASDFIDENELPPPLPLRPKGSVACQ